jgi:hypothetical protein
MIEKLEGISGGKEGEKKNANKNHGLERSYYSGP